VRCGPSSLPAWMVRASEVFLSQGFLCDRADRAMAKTQTSVKTLPPESGDGQPYELVEVDKLFFNGDNPRLAEFALGDKPTHQDLLKILWQKVAVDEVAMSIAARGYFPHEPLFVDEEGGKLVVIEGNRRLAAVKLLLDPEARKRLKIADLPSINPKLAKGLAKLPVVRTTRKDLWQFSVSSTSMGPPSGGPTPRRGTSRGCVGILVFLWRLSRSRSASRSACLGVAMSPDLAIGED
jgi:hypothetical protein